MQRAVRSLIESRNPAVSVACLLAFNFWPFGMRARRRGVMCRCRRPIAEQIGLSDPTLTAGVRRRPARPHRSMSGGTASDSVRGIFTRSADISQPAVRPPAPRRGRRNDRRADDAAVRSRGNRRDHHGARFRVRRMGHGCASSEFAACTGPDWRR